MDETQAMRRPETTLARLLRLQGWTTKESKEINKCLESQNDQALFAILDTKKPPTQITEVHHRFEPAVVSLIEQVLCSNREILSQGARIMATQQQLAEDLRQVTAQVTKIGTEVSATLVKVGELETALTEAKNVSPEVMEAFNALKAQAQAADDLIPDTTPPTP